MFKRENRKMESKICQIRKTENLNAPSIFYMLRWNWTRDKFLIIEIGGNMIDGALKLLAPGNIYYV